jgi:hypothetical protein
MGKRLIRVDLFGEYVQTGGYVFRPLAVAKRSFFPSDRLYATQAERVLGDAYAATNETKLTPGERATAEHVGGTTTARVGDERWVSSCIDPQYRRYTDRWGT